MARDGGKKREPRGPARKPKGEPAIEMAAPASRSSRHIRRGLYIVWETIAVVSVIVGVVTGFDAMRPRLTIQPAAAPELGDPHGAWAFTATNDGWWSINDVWVKCSARLTMYRPDMPTDTKDYYLGLHPKPQSTPRLERGTSFPVSCASAASTQQLTTRYAAVRFDAAYKVPWWPFWWRDTLRFTTAPAGTAQAWVRCPASVCRDEIFDTPAGVPKQPLNGAAKQDITLDVENAPAVEPKPR